MNTNSFLMRIFLILGVFVVLLLPFLLYFFKFPKIATLLPSLNNTVNHSYSANSEIPGYSLKLVDTQYLEYLTAKIGVFAKNAINDPRIHRNEIPLVEKSSVSKIQFTLVPKPVEFLFARTKGNGKGKTIFAGTGSYSVKGDTLIVPIYINIDELSQDNMMQKYTLEDQYIQIAATALYYTNGISSQSEQSNQFVSIQKDINEYLYNGIFPWPFRVEKT